MSGEWMKSSIAELIQAYKMQENLYNQKHKLYFNKQARNISLNSILASVQQNRPETTLSDITKKIQTLRTQFGQEVNKIEKSQILGENLTYVPKIWWFSHLKWIGDYMKTRDSKSLVSMIRARVPEKTEIKEKTEPLFEFADEVDDSSPLDDQFTTEIEYSEYDTETNEITPTPAKKPKTYHVPKNARKQEIPEMHTIEYTLIADDVVQSTSKKPVQQYIESREEIDSNQSQKCRRRSKAFGKFVSALMVDLKDDKIFFDLQKSITQSIFDATMNQLDVNKS